MDRFLEKFNLLRLNQEEIEIMNNPTASTEISVVIENLLKSKSPWTDGFTGEFYQTFWEELMSILLKIFQKIAEEGTLPNSFILWDHHHPDTKTRQWQHTHTHARTCTHTIYSPISQINIDAKILKKF